jgi:hypothetical protein
MRSTGTYYRAVGMFAVWAMLFMLSYIAMPSRAEEQVATLQRSLEGTKHSTSMTAVEQVYLNDREKIRVDSRVQRDPDRAYALSTLRLTDRESFRFEVYFLEDAIYFRGVEEEAWRKVSDTDPVSGQLLPLRDPASVWLHLLTHVKTMESRLVGNGLTEYRVTLHSPDGDIHGIPLHDIASSEMTVRTAAQPAVAVEAELRLSLKPNILRGYDRLLYRTSFMDLHRSPAITVPEDLILAGDE